MSKPMLFTSVRNVAGATKLIPAVCRPNSLADLSVLTISLPPLATTTPFAFDACAARINALKSCMPTGCLTEPSVLPSPRDPGGDIWLVLVIAADRLDRLAQHRAAQFLDRHFGGGEGPRATLVGKIAGHVVEHADGDRLRLRLCMREHGRAGQYAACREHGTYCHDIPRRRMRSFVR